jgi:predicted nuclease of predicted toxin-antitoxin system
VRRPALLLDENVSYHLAHALRERGWDVLHIKDIGMRSAKDPAVLDLAVRSNRIVLTSDFADYSRLDQIYVKNLDRIRVFCYCQSEQYQR